MLYSNWPDIWAVLIHLDRKLRFQTLVVKNQVDRLEFCAYAKSSIGALFHDINVLKSSQTGKDHLGNLPL